MGAGGGCNIQGASNEFLVGHYLALIIKILVVIINIIVQCEVFGLFLMLS